MKVLNIPAWYPNGEDKLIGNYHVEYTKCLNDNGISSDMLFVYRMRIKKPLEYLKEKKEVIIHHENFDCFIYKMLNIKSISKQLQLKNYIKTMEYGLKKYIEHKGKVDILHAHTIFPTGYAATVVGKKYHIPVVITDHSDMLVGFGKEEMGKDTHFNNFTKEYIQEYPKYFDYMKEIFEYSYLTSVNSLCESDVKRYTDRFDVLPNVVKTDEYSIVKNKELKPFRFVSVCAFREGKNLEYGMQATKQLVDEGYNVQYDLVGAGFLDNYYRNKAKELNAEKCVSFLGRMDKKQINDVFKTHHCLLMPSNRETFGIPAIESLAAGVPVIISDACLGPKEFVNDNCGYFFKNEDVEDLKNKMIQMMETYSNFNQEEMRKIALKYSPNEIAKVGKAIYNKVIK